MIEEVVYLSKGCLKYGTAQFKLDTRVLVHACTCTFCMCKVYNLACISFVACKFVVRTRAIKHSWHTRRAPHQQIRHKCTSTKPYMKHTWRTTR